MKVAPARLLALVLAAGLLLASSASTRPAAAQGTPPFLFGTLLSDPRDSAAEYAAGVRVVHLELGWDAYEPREGQFNELYAAEARARLRNFQDAGMLVVLGLGIQYPPRWVYDYPNSVYVNQHGRTEGTPNLTFNQTLRERVERYIARVAVDLGPRSFWAVRIGSGGLVEALYPGDWDDGPGNSYWAYDLAAQWGVGLPPSLAPSSYPGWKPGERRYGGGRFSTSQVREWYDWYLGALVDGIRWQIAAYDWYGFSGYKQVLMPGIGSRPAEVDAGIASYLDGAGDPDGSLARGAAWHRVVERLADLPGVVVYVSSVADGSGRDDTCRIDDRWTSLHDPAIASWSSARWITYNADRYGLPKMGENPGRADSPAYGRRMSEAATRQMQSCGFQGLMWAHASNLREGTGGLTLWDYSAVIARYTR